MSGSFQERIHVLHVDDEPDFADLTGTFLEREDERFTVETATSADDALQHTNDRPPDCIISDYNMPGMDGIEFLQTVREEYPDLPFILYTGKGSEAVASEAIAAGVTDYLQKGSGSEQYELLANRILNAVKQHRSEERLRQTQREYAAVFENAQNGLLLVAVEGDGFRYQQCNPRAVELIGRDKTEIVGKTPYEALGPENGKNVVEAYRTCTEQGNPVEYTVTLDLPMGQVIRECEATPVPVNGEVEQLVVSFQDITDRRERQQELRRNKRAMEKAPVGITLSDPSQDDNPLVYVNDRFEEVTGYDEDETVGRNCRLLQGDDTRAEPVAQMREAIDAQDPVTVELRNYRKDGTEFWNRVSIAPVYDDQGSVVNFVGFQQDITERRERQRELERTTDLMSNMEQMADVGAWEYDSDTETLVMTDGAYRIHGLDPEVDLTLEEAFDNFHPDDRDVLAGRFDECLETGDPYEVDVRLTTVEGTQMWVTARGERVSDDGDGSVVRGYIRNITEQRAHERNLERYRTVLNSLPDPVVVYDEDGRYDIVNDAAAEIRDVPREELTGTKSPYLEQIREEHPAEYDALLDGHRDTLDVELTAEFSGLGTRTLDCRLSRMTDTVGPDGIVIVTRDATDRNERERQLNRERQRYTTLFETLRTPVLHVSVEDGEPVVQTVNPAFEDTFGYDAETIRDEPVHDYVLPDDRTAAAERLNQQVPTEGEVQTEVERETTEGVRTFRLDVRIRNTESEDYEGYAVYTDITERKEREQERERQYEAIFNQTYQFIGLMEPDGTLIEVNEPALEFGGLDHEHVIGKPFWNAYWWQIDDETRRELREAIERAADGEFVRYDVEIQGEDENTVIDFSIRPVTDEDGEVTYLIPEGRDITELKSLQDREQELEDQNERLREFASIVSHDLRNPLTVAEGHLELAQETCESDHLIQVADAIDRSQALIDDLLALAREGDRVDETEPVGPAEVAESSWQTVEMRQATLDADASQVIEADRSRLQQLLENLYRNAVEHGGDDVTVSVGVMDDGFYVADTGPGITESDREEVFEAGYSTNVDGTGFGLRIVEQIANAHGWEVTVTESEQGGARFEISGVEFADH